MTGISLTSISCRFVLFLVVPVSISPINIPECIKALIFRMKPTVPAIARWTTCGLSTRYFLILGCRTSTPNVDIEHCGLIDRSSWFACWFVGLPGCFLCLFAGLVCSVHVVC